MTVFLVPQGGRKRAVPADTVDTLRGGRKGDPQQKVEGKNQKYVFVKNRAIFLLFGPWCTLQGPCALKILSRFQARNGPKTLENWIFTVLGAVLGEPPAHQILIAR